MQNTWKSHEFFKWLMNLNCYGIFMVFRIRPWNISRFFTVCKFMGHEHPLNGKFLMAMKILKVLFWPFHSIFMAHEMYFVPGPLTFLWVKVMAKWYEENGSKNPLKVSHFKNYAYLNLSHCAFYLTYKSLDIQFTTKTNWSINLLS